MPRVWRYNRLGTVTAETPNDRFFMAEFEPKILREPDFRKRSVWTAAVQAVFSRVQFFVFKLSFRHDRAGAAAIYR